jgi:hypothetical protein
MKIHFLKVYGEIDTKLHTFLTSVLDEDQASFPRELSRQPLDGILGDSQR